ncbi:hypothetical protein OHS18_38255 [Amycolatopsis sp. NBC_00355]|uniref:calcium-binding protein n=1 Tax=Amycolatopsis sp. NBC_00355 TaxID=2975957 RepID=UPI002E25C044
MFSRRRIRRTVLGPLVAGTAMIGAAGLTAVPAHAAPAGVTVALNGSVLTVTGDAGNNGLVVGRTPAGTITLNGAVVLGGTATTATVSLIHMDGGAGDDTLKFDETNGVMPQGEFVGGDGRDKITGGSGADTIVGGPGNDRVVGGPGNDTVSLGADTDEFTLNTGDGNDHLDGGAGTDGLIVNGSPTIPSFTETVLVSANGPRTTLRRVQPTAPSTVIQDVLDVGGVEQVKLNLASGPTDARPNSVSVAGLGTDISVMRVNLGSFVSPNPGLRNTFNISGTDGPDRIRIAGSAAKGVSVSGAGSGAVLVTGAQFFGVSGNAGDDVIDAGVLPAGTVETLIESGDASPILTPGGNDILVGSPGNDELFGGVGDDRLEGRGGNDILDGGAGNNVIIP